jgi:hypothetical protein
MLLSLIWFLWPISCSDLFSSDILKRNIFSILKSLNSYRELSYVIKKAKSIPYPLYFDYFYLPYRDEKFPLWVKNISDIALIPSSYFKMREIAVERIKNPSGMTNETRRKLFWGILNNYRERALMQTRRIATFPLNSSLFPLQLSAKKDLKIFFWAHARKLAKKSFHPDFPRHIDAINARKILKETQAYYTSEENLIPSSMQTFIPRVLCEAIRLLCLEEWLNKSQAPLSQIFELKPLHEILGIKITEAAEKLVSSVMLSSTISSPDSSFFLISLESKSKTRISCVEFLVVTADCRADPMFNILLTDENVLQIYFSDNINNEVLISTLVRVRELIETGNQINYIELEMIINGTI